MLKKTLFVLAMIAAPTAAFAQGDDTGAGAGTDTSGGEAATAGNTAATTAGDQMAATGSGPAIFKHGTMGLSFPVLGFTLDLGGLAGATTTPVVHPVNILYFMDSANALDLIAGVNLAVTPDHTDAAGNPVAGATTFGFAVGAGYRMYKHHSARIHTFLEPRALIGVNDVSSFADVLTLSIGANLGAECMFTDWFSVLGTIGASADFSDKFKSINVGTLTGGLMANFYWD
jgi:hypothetical protein